MNSDTLRIGYANDLIQNNQKLQQDIDQSAVLFIKYEKDRKEAHTIYLYPQRYKMNREETIILSHITTLETSSKEAQTGAH